MEQFYEGLHADLELYVRMLAWWHTSPDPPKGTPAHFERRSRMQLREEAGGHISLPEFPLELLGIVQLLFEAGPASIIGDNQMPITWADLDHYQNCIGVRLPPWQLRLLRSLSGVYVQQVRESRSSDAPAPWDENASLDRKLKVAKHIKAVLRGG